MGVKYLSVPLKKKIWGRIYNGMLPDDREPLEILAIDYQGDETKYLITMGIYLGIDIGLKGEKNNKVARV